MPAYPFFRPTYVEINLSAILSNVSHLEQQLPPDTVVIPVVKANAYGHGAIEVATFLEQQGYMLMAVATPDEAIELREAGIQAELLVLGACPHSFLDYASAHDIHLTAFSIQWLKQIPTRVAVKLHLKLDTGMGRIGLSNTEEINEAIELFKEHSNWTLEGIYTHFSTADEDLNSHFEKQFQQFEEWLTLFPETPKWIHAANSAAAIQHPKTAFTAVRFGISMYGIAASPWMRESTTFPYQPAMQLVSELIQVKKVSPGTAIGYGASYQSEGEEWIGTLPIGYADGLLRGLKHMHVIVDDTFAPIVGKICMDQTMIKLPREFKIGTKVVLLGSNGINSIPAEEWAKHLHTIPYEICCQLSTRIPRVYPDISK